MFKKDNDPGLNRNPDAEPRLLQFPIVVKNPERIAAKINAIRPVFEGEDRWNINWRHQTIKNKSIILPSGQIFEFNADIELKYRRGKMQSSGDKALSIRFFSKDAQNNTAKYVLNFNEMPQAISLINQKRQLRSYILFKHSRDDQVTKKEMMADAWDLDLNLLSNPEARQEFIQAYLTSLAKVVFQFWYLHYLKLTPEDYSWKDDRLKHEACLQLQSTGETDEELLLKVESFFRQRSSSSKPFFSKELYNFFRIVYPNRRFAGVGYGSFTIFLNNLQPVNIDLSGGSLEELKGYPQLKVDHIYDTAISFHTKYPVPSDISEKLTAQDILGLAEVMSDTLGAYFQVKNFPFPNEPLVIELDDDDGDVIDDQIIPVERIPSEDDQNEDADSGSSVSVQANKETEGNQKQSSSTKRNEQFKLSATMPSGFEAIGGQQQAVEKAKILVSVINNLEAYSKRGVRPPKGVLFIGPPGTGKTLMARIIAQESQAEFIHIKITDILSKWFGESSQNILEYFQRARQLTAEGKKVILFMDELEALGKKRADNDDPINRVVSTLLTELDGIDKNNNIILLASSNHRDMIDPAILRSGRIDEEVLFDLPNQDGLVSIFKIHVKNIESSASSGEVLFDPGINWEVAAAYAFESHFVGADIENLLQQVLRKKINDEIQGIKNFSPVSVNEIILAIAQFKAR